MKTVDRKQAKECKRYEEVLNSIKDFFSEYDGSSLSPEEIEKDFETADFELKRCRAFLNRQ
jgi:hypothetical protein